MHNLALLTAASYKHRECDKHFYYKFIITTKYKRKKREKKMCIIFFICETFLKLHELLLFLLKSFTIFEITLLISTEIGMWQKTDRCYEEKLFPSLPPCISMFSFSISHLSSLLSRVLLQLVDEVTLLMLLLRRVFNESPKLETPFAVMEKDRSL